MDAFNSFLSRTQKSKTDRKTRLKKKARRDIERFKKTAGEHTQGEELEKRILRKKEEFLTNNPEGSLKERTMRFTFILIVFFIWMGLESSNQMSQQLSYIIIGYLFKNPFIIPDWGEISSREFLTVPLKLMSAISEKTMGDNNRLGESISTVVGLLGGAGTVGTTKVSENLAGILAKLIFYIPSLLISLLGYAIPIMAQIVLIPLMLIALIIPFFGELFDSVSGSAEGLFDILDQYLLGWALRTWKLLNKVIPVKDGVRMYIIGFIVFNLVKPLFKMYVLFFIFCLVWWFLSLLKKVIEYGSDKMLKKKPYIRAIVNIILIFAFYGILIKTMVDLFTNRYVFPWSSLWFVETNEGVEEHIDTWIYTSDEKDPEAMRRRSFFTMILLPILGIIYKGYEHFKES
jgi:hypothetical protein